MQSNSAVTPRSGAGVAQLPASPCYLIRHDSGMGLQWLADAKAAWRLADGRPALIALSEAAALTAPHLFRLKATPGMPPSNPTIARLVKVASRAHGVPREVAMAKLFWFFDPDIPSDVRRLKSYLGTPTPVESVAA